jgi:D-alanyl-D-alanine carboxypeptidase
MIRKYSIKMISLLLWVGMTLPMHTLEMGLDAISVHKNVFDAQQMLPFASVASATSLGVIVNKTYHLPAHYRPDDLTTPDIRFTFDGAHEKRLLREPAARAAEALFQAAQAQGIQLLAVSGFRSFPTQQALYAFKLQRQGEAHVSRYSAVAGASEHQTGLALDVTSASVDFMLLPRFADTPEGQWLARHAHAYGFVMRYPEGKEHITGYAYEPWHIRYVDCSIAYVAFHQHLTLEEMNNNFYAIPWDRIDLTDTTSCPHNATLHSSISSSTRVYR